MNEKCEVLIVGSGFGGLGMGRQLKQVGLEDFLILEKAEEVGGTWRENTYPGAECDVASSLYSYSFAPNPEWEHKWSKQKQILEYQKSCAQSFGLMSHIRFGVKVCSAVYNESKMRWLVTTENGDTYDCRHFVCAVGQLHHPNTPSFPGQSEFSGDSFHSAQWQHDVDLEGKRVAIVGSAASALQFIPEVAKMASQVTIYQRSANWILAKGNRSYTKFEKWISRNIPPLAVVYRLGVWAKQEFVVYPMIKGNRFFQWLGRAMFTRNLSKHINDPELRAKLTPDYPIGAKRILVSDTLFPSLSRTNVELTNSGIAQVLPTGILDSAGNERSYDVIIYGTGFKTNPFLLNIEVVGAQDRKLRETWTKGARAYMGISVAGFPNLHLLYGPNTNTGHSSIIFKLEAQIRYIAQLIQRAGDGAIDVRQENADEFDAEMQRRLSTTAWNEVDGSWYKDGDRITNNWPGSSWEYYSRTKKPNTEHFQVMQAETAA